MYREPDFSSDRLRSAPDATFVPAPADGVLPDNFFSTTNLPTYVRVQGHWQMPEEPRMDGAIIREADGSLWVREMRRVRQGQQVAVGLKEDGSEGILVHNGFAPEAGNAEAFAFMSSDVSREKPMDYDRIIAELEHHRRHGHILWVVGPALVHSRGRDEMAWLVRNGYVHTFFGGNAVGVHDIEADIMGTTLGMTNAGTPVEGGHAAHMRAINAIRRAGSIRDAVRLGVLNGGIMHALESEGVPYILGGSVRDDGPLPETVTDMLELQDAMREHTVRATMVVMVATALHSIATGNMLPAFYRDSEGQIQPITTVCVDSTEFTVSKLKDRGTHQAYGLVTNAQDFMRIIVSALKERERELAGAR